MVEYKKRLINLKGGGTRNYYTKTYKNGKEVRVKKDEYMAKGGEGEVNDLSKFLKPKLVEKNNLTKYSPSKINESQRNIIFDSILRCMNAKVTESDKQFSYTGDDFKNYIKGYKTIRSKECNKNNKYQVLYFDEKKKQGEDIIKRDDERCIINLEDSYIYNNKFFDYVNLYKNGEIVAFLYTKDAAIKYYEMFEEDIKKYLKEKNIQMSNNPLL
jgi:hypothetical protein